MSSGEKPPRISESGSGWVTPTVNPEEKASILSRVTFWYLTPLIRLGALRPLNQADLYPLCEWDKAAQLSARFDKSVDEIDAIEQSRKATEGDAYTPGKGGNLLFSAIWRTYRSQFIFAGVIKFIHDLIQLTPPLLLNGILRYMNEAETGVFYEIFGKQYGWYCAGGMFVMPMCKSLLEGQYFQRMFRLGVNLKAGVVSHVYSKSLRLSNQGRKAQSVGDIITLMQVDTQRLFDTAPFLHTVWSGMFQMLANIGILIYYLGPSALAGVAVMIALVPLQMKLGKLMMKLTRVVLKATGERTKFVNEALQGMKVVKAYAWERPTREQINDVRKQETAAMKTKFTVRAVQSMIMMAAPNMVMLATFLVYAGIADGDMDPATVFTSVALFNALRAPMMMYPMVLNALLSGRVSLDRIGKFFTGAGESSIREYLEPAADMVTVKGTFKWAAAPEKPPAAGKPGETKPAADVTPEKEEVEPFALKDIDITVSRGEMLAVVGPVGSGKSSFAGALLGEMEQTGGSEPTLRGRIAYCAQQPWILNTTLRENILFGKEMDPKLYREVLEACALAQDLQQLPGGDMTEIGERGINLSGGQKARVSLARACYADADVYIFDDPLSAVDAHVGAHLFSKCLSGLLKDKTRVLITNQLTCVPSCDKVVVLEEGDVMEEGTYQDLMDKRSDFYQLMKNSGASAAAGKPGQEHGGGDADVAQEDKGANGHSTSSANGNGAAAAAAPAPPAAAAAAPADRHAGKTDEDKEKKGVLVDKERMARGVIERNIVLKYATMAGFHWPVIIILIYITVQGGDAMVKLWLSFWSQDKFDEPVSFYLIWYSVISVAGAALMFVRTLVIAFVGLKIARILHKRLTTRVLRAPMSFFDTTPGGRILNRFGADQATIDEQLPFQWSMMLNLLFMVLSTFVVITIVTPWWAAVFAPVMTLYYFTQNLYRKSARELKRLDSVSRSPVYQQFTETLNGLSTIRAYGHEDRFCQLSNKNLDANNMAFFLLKTCDRWLSLRLDVMGNVLVSSAALLAVAQRDNLYAGLAGVSIDYALQITFGLSFLVRNLTELENQLNAVERNLEYADGLESEAPEIVEGHRPPAEWPSKGAVDFENVTMRYRPGLDLVLKGVTISVLPGEKVGVVGRTGAGKSSLMLTLFRLVEPAGGRIMVDGLNIGEMGLEDLRSRLAIIPQDPVLFSGTVRSNLDPFGRHTDIQMWNALSRAHLKEKVSAREGDLDAEVAEFGENFSVGERQLLCMARVLLREAKVMVMDEATSSVDFDTDSLIQRTVREDLGGTTLLTIAHRIHTVIDANKVLVMNAGLASEYDSPANLLDKPDGEFAALVANTGKDSEKHLRKIAKGELDFFASYDMVRRSSMESERAESRHGSVDIVRSTDL